VLVGPLTFRAGFANDFAAGFDFKWALDFVGRTWGQLILGFFMLLLISLVAQIAGALMCLVGLMITMPLAQLMITDLGAQLYDIYLTRGGAPVPIKKIEV
jgi:hypothetical protein